MVDSDARGREVLVQRIRGRGFDADTAATAAEAIEKMSSERYDFLLLEVVMPHDASLEILEWMRGMSAPPRCIVMSGVAGLWRRANPGIIVAGLLEKPFSIDELIAVINGCPSAAPRRTSRGPIVVKITTSRDHA